MRTQALLGCLLWTAAAGAVQAPKPAAKPPATSPAPSKKAPAKKTAAAKKAPAGKPTAAGKKRPTVSKKSRSKKRLPTWRTSQQAPTRERYLEIQQALAARGFLEGAPTGVWGPDSVAALKKFQAAQNLEPSGKLDALSLIAMGLGPKRATDGPKPPPPGEPRQP